MKCSRSRTWQIMENNELMNQKKYIRIIIALSFAILALLGYLAYMNYLNHNRIIFDRNDAQNQINYSVDTKDLLNSKPFIDQLPYISQDFDVYYSTDTDEVEIFMKNQGMTFDEAQKADQEEINNFLQNIGVDSSKQTIVLSLLQ